MNEKTSHRYVKKNATNKFVIDVNDHWNHQNGAIIALEDDARFLMEYLRSNYDPLHMFVHKLSYKANWASVTRVACHACRAYCTARRHSMQPCALCATRSARQATCQYVCIFAWKGACLARLLRLIRYDRFQKISNSGF